MIQPADPIPIDPAPALTRGLALLNRLQTDGPATLEHLAHRCGWPKSSVARLLTSLESSGTVRRDARSRAYHPLKQLVPIQTGADALRDAAAASLDELCERVRQTIELHLFNPPEQLVMLDRREPGDAEVLVRARVGSVRDLTEFESLAQNCIAFADLSVAKKAWHWHNGRRKKITRRLAESTRDAVRRDRVAVDLDTNSNGVRRYAAPLFGSRTTSAHPSFIGCIAIAQACPPHAVDPDPRLVAAVRSAAARFSPAL